MNNLLLLTALVATLVAILAVLRNRLVFELQSTSLLLFDNTRPGILLYAFLMLPGTIIHELSHWLVAELVRVPTGEITIFPKFDGEASKSQNLGSVATGRADPFRGLLIGAAPFLVGTGILVVLSTLLRDFWGIAPWWQLALLLYGLMVMGNSMLVSEADRHNWPIAIGVIALLSTIIWNLGMRPTPELVITLTTASQTLLLVLGLTAALNLATIGACTLVRKSVEKISHKKIIRH